MKKIALFLGAFALLVLPAGAHASAASDVGQQIGAAVTELQNRIADLQALQTVIQADPGTLTAAAAGGFNFGSTTGACPDLYLPVCGTVGGVQSTYPNTCKLQQAGATFVSSGQCGSDSSGGGGWSGGGAASSTAALRICSITRRLARGTAGDDVSAFQDFLRDEGFFKEATSTGFFGKITEAALQAWQASHGIASTGDANTTGWGSAGPKTREYIRGRWCGIPPQPKPCSTTTPACGVPRTTCGLGQNCIQIVSTPTTYPTGCALQDAGAAYLHDGACTGTENAPKPRDDSQGSNGTTTAPRIKPPTNLCSDLYLPVCGTLSGVQSTYPNTCKLQQAGATFVASGECGNSNSGQQGTDGSSSGSSGSGTGGTGTTTLPRPPSACPDLYLPVCGTVGGVQSTYPNTCKLQQAGATFVSNGECSTAGSGQQGTGTTTLRTLPKFDPGNGTPPGIPSTCKVWYDGCNTCTRISPGSGPVACTLRACVDTSLHISDAPAAVPYCIQSF